MQPDKLRVPYILTGALAGLMTVQSALGLLLRAHYRDVEWIRATWLGNDGLTLIVAVPLLVIARAFARRGSTRGMLAWLGLLGYAAYNYAYYLFGAALNCFFPLYVVTFVVSVVTLILALSAVDAAAVAARFRPTTPVRIIGGYLAFVGLGLAAVWISELPMWGTLAACTTAVTLLLLKNVRRERPLLL
jgi:hypothetical protein